MPTPFVNYALRLPADLDEQVRELAKRSDRSINNYITHILRTYVEDALARDNDLLKHQRLEHVVGPSPRRLQERDDLRDVTISHE